MRRRLLLVAALVTGMTGASWAAGDDVVDFSDQVTPVCELPGLTAHPPAGWFNVPIQSADEAIAGCQMMRADENEALVGIIRVLVVQLPGDGGDKWFPTLVELERQLIAPMGYALGDVLWMKKEVPVSGTGFEEGRAVGLEASIEGNDIPQEAQFLGFSGEAGKYILTLLTPGRDVDEGVYYRDNQEGFKNLIQKGLNVKSGH